MDFIKRCIARIIRFNGYDSKSVYVGGPISYSMVMEKVRDSFPHAKFVTCVRNPEQAFPSMCDLALSLVKEEITDFYIDRTRIRFDMYSVPIYKSMAAFTDPKDMCYWLDFENWKKDGKSEIERVWRWLGWSFDPCDSDVALLKPEKHTNRPEVFKLVSPDYMREKIGAEFQICVRKC
jgi:hypothetical protein